MPPSFVVATDLDGTLLRSDGTVSDRTRQALAAAEEAGALVAFVTGRPPRWMAAVAEATGHRGLAVCANGALVYDLAREEVVRSDVMDVGAAAEVVEALRDAIPGVAFAAERLDGFRHEAAYRMRYDLATARLVEDAELLDAPLVKLLVRLEGDFDPDDLMARAVEVVGARATVTRSAPDGLLELSASSVTKASGLARLVEDVGAGSHDVTAFGDMPNDLPLLEWAGWAVAVANAHPTVRELADEVSTSNDEDGVARVVERLVRRAEEGAA